MNEELTSMLIQYTSPIAAAQFPRFVNTETSMQAASPAFEITRLLNLLGIGLDAIEIFGYILILAAILGIFIALMNSMRERKYDLAIMRTLGGSRFKLFSHIILEGIIIAITGGLLGIFLGHAAVEGIGYWMAEAQQFAIRGFVILPGELRIFALAVGIGIISSIVPAVQAYRTDIAETLSKS
jgi:putative ABC transport system permease protein